MSTYFKGIEDDTRYPYPEEEVSLLIKELTLDSEAATSSVFSGDVGYVQRKMASVREIYRYWGITLVKLNKFDTLFEVEDGDHSICWRCGWVSHGTSLERAHILPRCLGGSDEAANLHMLCVSCHRTSEDLWGKQYWSWFMSDPSTSQLDRDYVVSRLARRGFCTKTDFDANRNNTEWLQALLDQILLATPELNVDIMKNSMV